MNATRQNFFRTQFDRLVKLLPKNTGAPNGDIGNRKPQIANRYEAGIPNSPDRPYIPAFVRDVRFDANSFTRWEITRKARYERMNNWLLSVLERCDVKYTVGPFGHVVIPTSSDSTWNQYAAEAYQNWCEAPFRDSALPMFMGHQLARKEMHVDGEVFENCTFLKVPGQQSVPAVELVESHRVSSPGLEYDYSSIGNDIVDGVQLTRDAAGELYGRPKGFHVRLGTEGEKWVLRPAFDPRMPGRGGMIHTCDPDRIGMARSISKYAPVLNEIADLFLLWMFELDKSKSNSEVAAIWKTFSGQVPGSTFEGGGLPPTSVPGELSVPGSYTDKEITEKLKEFRKTVSARWLAIKPGEEMEIKENNNPSASQQWLWKFVVERVAMTRGVPMILVLPDSMQGTVTRAVLDDAQIGFTQQFAINARSAKMKYRFFMDWARYNAPKLQDAPGDWMSCHVVPPPQINVDFGRNMNAMLAGIDAGVYDYDDIIGKDGSTAEMRFLKKARNVGAAKKIALQVSKEMGVEIKPEEIIGNLAEISALLAKSNASATNDEDEDEVPAIPGKNQPTKS